MHIDRRSVEGLAASRTVKTVVQPRQNSSAAPSSGSETNDDGGSFNYVTTIVVSEAVYEVL
jgi:hypothetical protein